MKSQTKNTLKIFWNHARKYRLVVFLMIIGLLSATAANLAIPFFYKDFFNGLAENMPGPHLVSILLSVLGVALTEWFFWRMTTVLNNYLQPRVMADLLQTSFKHLHNHSYNFFNNNFAGSLVKKVTRFERSFEDITDIFFWEMGQTFLSIFAVIGILYFQNPVLSLIVVIWCLVYVGFNYAFVRFKLKYDIQRAEQDTKVAGHLADTITNNINLKLFGSATTEYGTFSRLTNELFRMRKFGWNLAAITEAFQSFMLIILQFSMFFFAIDFWQRGILTIGHFVLIQAYIFSILTRLWHLGKNMRQLYERLADANEMTEILMTDHEIKDKPDAKELNVTNGEIAYNEIKFGYHDAKAVFDNFNLTVRAGERVALIGPSGGGKTTIVKLLFRFFDIQSGEIKIDGQNIADVTQESLRSALALVPQEPILFHRSLYDNIAYARPSAKASEVYKAAELAHCHEFIINSPNKYDTFVGERGIKLSGGERQRVAIARAILKNAPILVLDEATSSLDSESEMLIQDALKTLMKGRTTIVIAHRLSTIMQMDRIIVIDDGKILEEGKHEELLKAKQGTYQKLWEIQAGGFAQTEATS